jgi:hypothetical protein
MRGGRLGFCNYRNLGAAPPAATTRPEFPNPTIATQYAVYSCSIVPPRLTSIRRLYVCTFVNTINFRLLSS